jgi:H+-transporting ATPase
VRRVADSLWQPVPWLLEATIVLELVMGQHLDALIIALLLAFNSGLTIVQEHRSGKALDLLKQRLAPNASVERDGAWQLMPAAALVPGDIIRISLGGVVPADVELIEGAVLLDQSMLTGESVAVDAQAGDKGYSGALVRRGEALARVTATGARSYFGKTAELVRIARAESREQKAVLHVVRNITAINGIVLAAIASYAHLLGLPTGSLLQLIVTAILASIPVALPATFSLAAALAAQALAHRGVLVTHLGGVHEAASVDTLCADKTGTLTRNELAVASVTSSELADRAEVLRLAAMASSGGGGDPVDGAIRTAADRERAVDARYRRQSFAPFDPALKRSSATIENSDHHVIEVMKGAFDSISKLAATPSALKDG